MRHFPAPGRDATPAAYRPTEANPSAPATLCVIAEPSRVVTAEWSPPPRRAPTLSPTRSAPVARTPCTERPVLAHPDMARLRALRGMSVHFARAVIAYMYCPGRGVRVSGRSAGWTDRR